MQFHLMVKSGAGRGLSWPIGERPLVLGRSDACDVVVLDTLVSRRHCEIVQTDSTIQLRDLGSVNATVVNGRLTLECPLKEGDEIALGSTIFVVVRSMAAAASPPDDRHTPATLALDRALYASSRARDSILEHLPAGVEDMHELFVLNRMFGNATTLAELLRVLNCHLQERLAPGALWMAWYLERERRLVPNTIDDVAADPAELPEEAMLKALESGSGLLVPSRVRAGKGQRLVTTLVAPLISAGESLGALAVRSAATRPIYDESDLQYLVAVAHALAPHLRATAHLEQLHRDLEQARRRAGLSPTLIGDSQPMVDLRALLATAAGSALSVLLLGETGTGKELAARMVHDLSARADHPFVVVNCAAIPRELFESEFFGHEKGAFTGAGHSRSGYFEEAHCGTLFLDEVGDLSPDNQARILRAIDTGTFYRVGSSQPIRVDVRVIAATNRLAGLPAPGSPFRADLYHRLSGFEIHMPPLRDHADDLPRLAEHFLEEIRGQSDAPVGRLTDAALERLRAWPWPGNVRELRACIHRAAALARSGPIQPQHILLTAPAAAPGAGNSQVLTLAEAEKHHIAQILRRMNGNVSAAARALQISRDTLYHKIRDYGIKV